MHEAVCRYVLCLNYISLITFHQAAREKAQQEKDSQARNMGMSRGGSRRGHDRGDGAQVGPDGWAVAGGSNAPRVSTKAGDLSNFGKINKSTAGSMTFGPSSVFTKKDGRRDGNVLSRTSSSSNMFSMLQAESAVEAPSTSRPSRPPSRNASVDLTASSESAPVQRPRLNLLPRSKPLSADSQEEKRSETSGPSQAASEDEGDEKAETAAPEMSEEQAKKKIDNDVKEFFAIRNLDEAEEYFKTLPASLRHLLVDRLVTSAIESKEADAKLVAEFFERAAQKNLCSPEAFEKGLLPTAEILDDIAIDAPKAFDLMAIIIKGAKLDEERRNRIAEKSMDSDKLKALLN